LKCGRIGQTRLVRTIVARARAIRPEDPLVQVRHFCAVIRGKAQPLVSGREGLNTLKVIAAIKQSAAAGAMVNS